MKKFNATLLFLCFFFLFSHYFYAQSKNPKKIYTTKKISETVDIDGIMDESVWNEVPWGNEFIENEPDENTAPTFQTQFKMLYDEKFLYVGIKAFDTAPDSIVRYLSRRDGFLGDRLNVVIDSDNDMQSAFVFTVTAAGVKGDEIATEMGDEIDDSWNPIWYTKVAMHADGWTAEMKIPFSQLRFGNEPEQVWGMSLARTIFRKNEMSVWNRVPAGSPGWVSELGELHGLKNIKSQKQFEVQPFALTQYDSYPAEPGNTYRDGSDFSLNGGLDAKIGVTNDLTLDLTVNPDFGQVEADPAAISLDGFQIFFDEKRPFFIENKNIFDFRFGDNRDNLFYSRRIGRSPQGYPQLGAGEYADLPQNATILGAAKFSGKTKSGWSIGLLESVTANEYAEIDSNRSKREELVEPLTNYLVGRLQKDFNNRNSFIGGIFTATNRNLEPNLVYLSSDAYSGGIDFKHQWKGRNYFLEGKFFASHVQGSKESMLRAQTSLTHLFQREDAGHVSVDPNRTSLTGTGGRVGIGKQGGGNWTYQAAVLWRSPELELNDIGFLRQADEIKQYTSIGYRALKPFGIFRSLNVRFDNFNTFDFDGNHNRNQYSIDANASFKNNWFLSVGGAHKPRIFINTTLRGGPRWRYSEENYGFMFFNTDNRKKVRFGGGIIYSGAKENNFSMFRSELGVTYQPSNALVISVRPEYAINPNKTQYVTTKDFNGTKRYILGKIKNETLSASIRLNYTINPNLTIQYYGQPFISKAVYSDFKYVTNPIADRLTDRYHQYVSSEILENNGVYEVREAQSSNSNPSYTFRNPNFSFVQFRSNLVVRWEYTPGSEIYLVWSQGINGLADTGRSLLEGINDEIFHSRPSNTFLIKATYRFIL